MPRKTYNFKLIPCACGCGGMARDRNRDGKPQKFLPGHHYKGDAKYALSSEAKNFMPGKCDKCGCYAKMSLWKAVGIERYLCTGCFDEWVEHWAMVTADAPITDEQCVVLINNWIIAGREQCAG